MVFPVRNQRLVKSFPMFRENGCFLLILGALPVLLLSLVPGFKAVIHSLQTPCACCFLSREVTKLPFAPGALNMRSHLISTTTLLERYDSIDE